MVSTYIFIFCFIFLLATVYTALNTQFKTTQVRSFNIEHTPNLKSNRLQMQIKNNDKQTTNTYCNIFKKNKKHIWFKSCSFPPPLFLPKTKNGW